MFDDRDATIIDVKTGQERPWHRVQVMIYQYALPLPQYRNVRIDGQVIYPTHTVRVPRGVLPRQFIDAVASASCWVAAGAPPQRVPSFAECRFCDITVVDYPDRVEEAGPAGEGSADDF